MLQTMAKTTSINLRISPDFREEIETLAAYHGLSMSSFAHSLLVKAVRREREETPEAFAKPKLAPVVARIEPAKKEKEVTRDDVRRMVSPDEIDEIQRRLKSGKGVPLAPMSKTKMPYIENTQEKKRKTR